ncbi:hypothetical protein CRM22_003297 [Opisthorchis felineus]|uniref:Uncharacterized protein n=1 Tax=Opisthorchis felineus TaxID=147828 RepID=A0A4S2M6V6_OPIFE|nr:hypothetical protein CRM22_003297 [Opisthorchis felineus]
MYSRNGVSKSCLNEYTKTPRFPGLACTYLSCSTCAGCVLVPLVALVWPLVMFRSRASSRDFVVAVRKNFGSVPASQRQ